MIMRRDGGMDAERLRALGRVRVRKVAFTGRCPPLHFDPPEHTPYRRAPNRVVCRLSIGVHAASRWY